ncbi:MAG: T9SS type A sorting domain-containing protein, partial [Chitinophagales bacterium]|nr:T9SS type A sorting domain-containing protein [Chitinophagales bacterium]
IATDQSGNSDTVVRTVIVGRTPVANFIVKSETQVGNGRRLTLEDKSSFSPTSWSWVFGPGASPATSQLRNPVVTYTTSGQKCIKLTASNSFGSDDTTICVNIVLDVDEVMLQHNLNIYPNPASNKLIVLLDGTAHEDVTVALYNNIGETVLQPIKKTILNQEEIILDVSALPAGSYFVKVQTPLATAVRQVAILK